MGFAALAADVNAAAEDVAVVLSDTAFHRELVGRDPRSASLPGAGRAVWGSRGSAACRVVALGPGLSRVRISLHRRALLAPLGLAKTRISRQFRALAEQVGAPVPVTRRESVP